jgi:hypothetical protein
MPKRWIKEKAKFIVENGIKLVIYENKEIYNVMCL